MSEPGPHILLVNVFFAPNRYGGATIQAENVARCLIKRHGARVTAVSAISREDVAPYAVIRAEVGGIPSYLINLPSGRNYTEHYQNPAVDAAIARIAAHTEPDLAHLHCMQELGAGAIEALKELGLPVIVSVHDHWWLCERQFMLRPDGKACGQDPVSLAGCAPCVDNLARTRARRDALHTALGRADVVTYPSAHALRLGVASGFAPDSSVLWENGVRLPGSGFAELQATRRARDGRWTLGFLGGPSAMKGWPLCRDAIIGLGRRDIRGLVVDGSLDGSWWQPADLKRLPGAWQIEPRFEPHDLDRVFSRIDILLFLSQWPETYGLVVREALARGVRVVQTAVGGAAEHGGAGLATILPLDARPGDVTEALAAILDRPLRPAPPVAVRALSDQADQFMRLASAASSGRAYRGQARSLTAP